MGVTRWDVEEIVRVLTDSPDTCIVLHPTLYPPTGSIRIRRDGHRTHLIRYLHEQLHGSLDPSIALLPGGCRTPGCHNPLHRIPSRRRTLPKRKDAHG